MKLNRPLQLQRQRQRRPPKRKSRRPLQRQLRRRFAEIADAPASCGAASSAPTEHSRRRRGCGVAESKAGTAWRAPTELFVQGGFDFGFGDGAFADYVPVVAVEADYGAG